MIRRFSIVFILVTLCSCGKDDGVNPLLLDNCDVLSNYTFDTDFTGDYGESIQYTNWKTQDTKTFTYSESASTFNLIDQQILCTEISYSPQVLLVYEEQNSNDYIQLMLSSYLDAEYIPMYFLEKVSGVFSDDVFDVLRFVNGTDFIHLDEHQRLVYHDQFDDILFGFDDRQGNQWLKMGTNASIFYCETRDNIDAYLETETSMQFLSLFETMEHAYTDGFATSYIFKPSSYSQFSNYTGEEPNATCVGGELEIQEFKNEYYDFRMADAYSVNYHLTTGFESVHSDNHYSLIELRIQYLLNYQELYNLRFVVNDTDLYEQQDYDTPFSEYEFHENLELNGSSYTEVYQFEYKDRPLYFNLEFGVLSFNDHLNTKQYLK